MPFSIPFGVLAFITIVSASFVVLSRNIVHAAVSLGASFVGIAGLYLLLQAPFIAGAQVLIYVGAVTVLILFALMLTAQRILREPRSALPWKMVSGALSFVIFALLVNMLSKAPWPLAPQSATPGYTAAAPGAEYNTVPPLANALLSTYLLPFEIASVLLLVALVGAIVLAKEERAD